MSDLRKLAAEVLGPAALEERFGPKQPSAVDSILLQKHASTDPDLLRVAATFNPDNILDVYENLGGSYSSKVRE